MPNAIQNDDVRTAPESGDATADGRKSNADQPSAKAATPSHPGDARLGEDRESGVIDQPK